MQSCVRAWVPQGGRGLSISTMRRRYWHGRSNCWGCSSAPLEPALAPVYPASDRTEHAMPDRIPIRTALISVSDKSGLVPFAKALVGQGAQIISTGGSARALRDAGVAVTEVSDHSGFPEI